MFRNKDLFFQGIKQNNWQVTYLHYLGRPGGSFFFFLFDNLWQQLLIVEVTKKTNKERDYQKCSTTRKYIGKQKHYSSSLSEDLEGSNESE